MISSMFSPAAVACLVDGRSPRPEEIDEMASKIWHDVYARGSSIAWNDVDQTSSVYRSVKVAALVSLGVLATAGSDIVATALQAA